MLDTHVNLMMFEQHLSPYYTMKDSDQKLLAGMHVDGGTWAILKKYKKLLRCIKMTSLLRQALKLSDQDKANLDVAKAPRPASVPYLA